MKNSLLLSLFLAVPAMAGTNEIVTESPPPQITQDTWSWFVGGSAGYLLDYEEDMYTLQFGGRSPWMVGGWTVAFFGEVGWTENHDAFDGYGPLGAASSGDLDIVPMTGNVKFEKSLNGPFSLYAGGGLGIAYVDAHYETLGGKRHTDDWIFTAQAFAGIAYNVNDNFEIFGGARWVYFGDTDWSGVDLDDDVLLEAGLRYHF